jgi:xylan 1,4-beta-xylosidase
LDVGARPIYNLGYGYLGMGMDKYAPAIPAPEDIARMARICVNIARHYNEGWASGFHHNIE